MTTLTGYSNWIDRHFEEANELLESGVHFGNKNQLTSAFHHFHKLHQIVPSEEITFKIVRALTALCLYDEPNAFAYLQKAMEFNPECPDVLNNLALIYKKQKQDYQTAIKYYQECLDKAPDFEQGYIGIADVYRTLRLHDMELQYVKKALEHCPESPDIYNLFGLAMINNMKLSDIASIHRVFDKGLSLCTKPEQNVVKSKIYMNKGHLQGVVGDFDAAVGNYIMAIMTDPENKLAYQNILLNLHYYSNEDLDDLDNNTIRNLCSRLGITIERKQGIADVIDAIHVAFSKAMYGKQLSKAKPLKRSADITKRLRIGYLSSDLVGHAVSYFAKALFTHYNKDAFEVYVYSDTIYSEGVVASFNVKAFKTVNDLSAEDLANVIRSDEIGVLIDLSGHTRGNRIDAMVYRPAPLMCTYLGYPDKLGIPFIKRITDRFTERTHPSDENLCMQRLFLCYTPIDMYSKLVKNYDKFKPKGTVTFGSFAKPQKINDYVIQIWCQILERVPNSRFIIKSRYFSDPKVTESWKARFGKYGDRLIALKGAKDQDEHMGMFRLLDVQLDTFPYSGTTITTESLFMNVPVITLCPENRSKGVGHVHRVSGHILKTIGMEDVCVAKTVEEYVDKAVAIIPKLKEIGVRNRMLKSAMCDQTNFMKDFEKLVTDAWLEVPSE